MRKMVAVLVACSPLLAGAQETPAPESAPQPEYTPPPPPQAAPLPPQAAPLPPQAAPPPPQAAPPPPQSFPPPPQFAPPAYPPDQPSPPRTEERRGPWYIGFGFGGGTGWVSDRTGSSSFNDFLGGNPTTVAFGFKVGATLTPKLLLGFDLTGVASASSQSGITSDLLIANYDAMLTFFPWRRGLFVRGGGGLSRLSVGVSSNGTTLTDEWNGTNLDAGVGYAFWLGHSFNLTVNLDYSAQFWTSHASALADPTSSSYWVLGMGFDWY